MYRKILVPVDGSSHSLYTLTQAAALAGEFAPGGRITVVNVGSYAVFAEGGMVVDMTAVLEEEGKAILARCDEVLAGSSLLHDSRYLTGDPAETICRVAKDEGYDLIVIGNRGRGLFAELLLGSVSHKVIQHAPCPVLVIRGEGPKKEKTPLKTGF